MSLVACLFGNGPVTLVADLLVSRPPSIGEPAAVQLLPTSPSGREISGIQETKLRRKLYIVNPRLAVGVAGNLSAMKRFVVAARERFGSSFATLDDVRAFKDSWSYPSDPENARQAIIGHADLQRTSTTSANVTATFYSEGEVDSGADVPGLGRIYAIGSGASAFIASASQTPPPREVGWGASYDAFVRVLGLAGSFLADETTTGSRLEEGWGAGFEFLGLFDGQFKRPASVTFTTWLRLHGGFALQSLIKYETLPNERMIAWALTRDGPRPFGALGLHEEPGEHAELPLPELTSDFVSHTFMTEHEGRMHSLVIAGTRETRGVILRKDGKMYEIGLEAPFSELMNRRLTALLAARKARGG